MAKADEAAPILATILGPEAMKPADMPKVLELGYAKGMSIPVPRSVGHMWRDRVYDTKKVYEQEHRFWDAAMREYRRCAGSLDSENDQIDYGYLLENDTDENMIRTITQSVMRKTYMQNPHVEFSAFGEGDEQQQHQDDMAACLRHIINYIMTKRTKPGVNMKAYCRRWILHTQLTNYGVVRLDYQSFTGSLEETQATIADIESKFMPDPKATNEDVVNATTAEDIEDLMARLEVAHEELNTRYSKGMSLTNVLSHKFFSDTEGSMLDLSDARFVFEEVDLSRKYIEQRYFTVIEDDEGNELQVYRSDMRTSARQSTSSANPATGGDDVKAKIADTVMSHTTEQRQELNLSDTVRVYYIYDKLLRRIYLYSDENWDVPLWVEQDNLNLSRFFRHFVMAFDEPIDGIAQPGQVNFYSGIVREINRINKRIKRIRDSVFGTLFYNSRAVDDKTAEVLEKHLRNPDEVRLHGVKLPEGMKINEVLEALSPPEMQYTQLFDTTNLRQAVDRVAGTTEVERGGEFKTNTTNLAIKKYEVSGHHREELLVDMIEDSLEELTWAMAEIIVSKYTPEEIRGMVGESWGKKFVSMTVNDFNIKYRMSVAASSIQKPTAQFKKDEAVTIAQAITQVGQAAPVSTLKLILRLFTNAFSGFNVRKEDFDALAAEGQATLMKGQTQPQAGQPASPQTNTAPQAPKP